MSKTELEKILTREEERITKETEEKEERKKRAQAIKRQHAACELALLPEKITLVKEIFDWAQHFTQEELYRRVRACDPHARGVYVFGGGWGHRGPYNDGHGCWSRIYLTEDAHLHYMSGYKYMGSEIDRIIPSPEEFATLLCHEYLSRLHTVVRSDEVYNRILQWHFKRKQASTQGDGIPSLNE